MHKQSYAGGNGYPLVSPRLRWNSVRMDRVRHALGRPGRRPPLGWVGLVMLAAAAWCAPAHAGIDEERRTLEANAADLEQRLIRCECTYDHADVDAYLQSVADRLLATDPSPPPGPVRVRALKSTSFDAFALPNGAVFVTTAMLQRLDSEAQLAAVLGHELTHFTQSHLLLALRADRRASMWARAITGLLLAGTAVVAAHNNIVMVPVSTPMARGTDKASRAEWVSGYTPEQERDADREGMRRLIAAGYDPGERVTLFERVAAATREDGADQTAHFSSHWGPANRGPGDRVLAGNELAVASSDGLGAGRDAYLAHTAGVALDQVALLIRVGLPDRAVSTLGPELERADSARGRYLQGEIARRRNPSAAGELEALAAYERAQALPDPPPEAFREAGLIHRRRGERGDATRALQRYLELAPAAADGPLVRAYLAIAAGPAPTSVAEDPR